MRYIVNRPDVVFERFEEEVVLVNLETGTYYSLSGTAPQIWEALDAGASQAEIVADIGATNSTEEAVVADVVDEFVQKLIEQSMLVEDEERPRPAESGPHRSDVDGMDGPFLPPVMEIYNDMQDLLLLDPIHEVDPKAGPWQIR